MKNKLVFLLILAVLFVCGYVAAFYVHQSAATAVYEQTVADSYLLQYFGGSNVETQQLFVKFGALAGPAFALLSLLVTFILYGLLKLVRVPRTVAAAISGLLVYGGLLALGIELMYFENRVVAWAIATILYIGWPLMVSAAVTLVVLISLTVRSVVTQSK